MNNSYKLIIFDLDGTLAELYSDTLYPDAAEWLASHPKQPIAIATNQGGVGLRRWMESEGFGQPDKYPTEEQIIARLDTLLDQFTSEFLSVQFSFAYQSKKSGKWSPVSIDEQKKPEWSPDRRKPAPGMLLDAISNAGVSPAEALMVGDREDDRLAAEAAGCDFMWAWEFFGRGKPEQGDS